ncbi:MAG: DUF1957 domain-containing protein [Treponema sp.]|nr:DUF1957 domain-containing protein [Treponema sp.]
MGAKHAVSLVLNAHFPFVREYVVPPKKDSQAEAAPPPSEEESLALESAEEGLFFETISETYLPLLEVMDRLEGDRVPFRLGLSVSPILGQMLCDERLMKKYAAHLDRQISFGVREIERLGHGDERSALVRRCLDRAIDRRAAFVTRYEGSVVNALNYYRRKEKIEILAAPATHAFMPFLCGFPESVQAQVEVGLSFYRYAMGVSPRGFWLPGLGWAGDLDPFLRSYGFGFTIADSHGFVFGDPPPSRGSFFPVRTPHGLFVLSRDHNAVTDVERMRREGPFRDNGRDAGHELPSSTIAPFLARNGARCHTGYKYWRATPDGAPYDPAEARAAAEGHAGAFLENRSEQLAEAAGHMAEQPISLCALDADVFGRLWHEGPHFLESLFRLAPRYGSLQFVTPSEYLCRQPVSAFEVSTPEFSSCGDNGYAEAWLGSPGDWVYRHLNRACERMVELAERFSGDSWVRERALNQAARELLLAQSSDWTAMMNRQESSGFARPRIEAALRNFTTIYDAMSSNHISTEWLTDLENQRGVFPGINYRVFRGKR